MEEQSGGSRIAHQAAIFVTSSRRTIDLAPGQRTGEFRLGTDQMLKDANGQSRISTQDYAVAMIDEVEKLAYIRQRFTVSY